MNSSLPAFSLSFAASSADCPLASSLPLISSPLPVSSPRPVSSLLLPSFPQTLTLGDHFEELDALLRQVLAYHLEDLVLLQRLSRDVRRI